MRRGRLTLLVAVAAGLILAAPASGRDVIVHSFDGTPLNVHFYPGDGASRQHKQPTVLVGPGWSMSGEVKGQGAVGVGGAFGVTSIDTFIAHGYNVLTWDPRGFGGSGGTVEIDDPRFEGRDVKALIDFVARQPEARIDSRRRKDPRVGMAGASYGGGIQLVTAGIDSRLDAIVPTIAWHSLITALFQDDAGKFGWGSILVAAGIEGATIPGAASPAGPQTGNHDPHFYSTFVDSLSTGHVSAGDKRWYASKGPYFLLRKIKTPTLLVQGTVDTLFPLDEAIRNFRKINNNTRRTGVKGARRGVPVKMVWFCGGHGACFTDTGPDGYVDGRTLDWFGRYLRGNRRRETGPRFAWIADDGRVRSSARFPGRRTGRLHAGGSGTLPLAAGPSGGGGLIFATPSPDGVNVDIPGPSRAANVLGAPRLRLTYRGTAAPAGTFVYAQIVDPRRNLVVGNQATPVPLKLDGRTHRISRKLEWLAARAPSGGGYQLQIVPATSVYDIQRSAGAVDFAKIDISLPLREPADH